MRRWMESRGAAVALSAGVAVVAFAAWEVTTWFVSPFLVPPPESVARALVDGWMDGTFVTHTAITLCEILLGFVFGSAIGCCTGALLASHAGIRVALQPYMLASQALPKVALAPLFVMWFGFGMTAKVVIAALIAFFPLMENTVLGLTSIEREYLMLMQSFQARPWHVFFKLRVPNALPYILAGLRIASVFSVIGAVVGEYIGANRGLGAMIVAAQATLDSAAMFAVFVILTALGLAVYYAVVWLERRIVKVPIGS